MSTGHRAALQWVLTLGMACLAPAMLNAQIGTTTEIIAGRVTKPDSTPIPGALVDVTSLASGVVRHTTTGNDGRFSLLFRDGGAQYRLVVRYVGMVPDTLLLAQRGDEDRLVAIVKLSPTPVKLAAIQVTAPNTRQGAPPASSAGGIEAALPSQLLIRIPVNGSDLAAMAALSPGVVAIAGNDTTPASFSVAGQPANQNKISVDGASFLFGTLPQNSIKAARIITNAYDVSRGQFTGGQVATTTQSGGTTFSGTATTNLQGRGFEFPNSNAPTFGQRYNAFTGSFGVGGPLVKDKAYYFVSAQHDYKGDSVASLLGGSSAALSNLGVNPDSVARFLSIVSRDGIATRATAPDTRSANTTIALGKIDWDVTSTSSLMLRVDYRHQGQDATRIGAFSLPATGGESSSHGQGFMASLTSSLGRFINEGRVFYQSNTQDVTGFLASPMGSVTVTSVLPTAQIGVASLSFGGNPSLPYHSTQHLFEASDEFSWLFHESHRIKLGALVNATRSNAEGIGNGYGTFIFSSLADFDAGHPSLFARTLASPAQHSGTNNGALYIGDAWRYNASLQFIYGARFETTSLPGAPANNPAVETAFGRRTDSWPTDFGVTPRVGFTYLLGNVAGIPSGSIKGGVGRFRGTVPDGLVGAVANVNGIAGSQSTLLCAGNAAPTPNWSAYIADPSTIPTSCANGASPSLSTSAPNVYLFDPKFGAPSSWRASLGGSKRFGLRYAINFDAMYALGVDAPYASDLNFAPTAFTLASEGNRPVFVPASAVVPSTGTSAGMPGRPHPEIGTVLNVASGQHSHTGQMALTLIGPGIRGGLTSLSYTWMKSTDQSNGFSLGNYLATTAGNPNVSEWGTSDLERRHQVVATVLSQFAHGFELSFIGRLISGAHYTPLVGGDINGDGARNDRAFIPGSGSLLDPTVQQLLAVTDSRAASCISAQRGQIATRNSCSTPWYSQLDMQVNWTPRAAMFDGRLTVSLVGANTFAGVDRLLHGSDLHGWGQPTFPDRTLLNVTGFDPSTQSFTYTVNQHFGTPLGKLNAYGTPFQLGLRAQVQLGTDPVKAQVRALTAGAGGKPPTMSEIKDRILKNVPYPAQMLLDQGDSLTLGLTPAEKTQLKAIAAMYKKQIDSIGEVVGKILVDAGPNPDLAALQPKFLSVNVFVVKTLQQVIKDMQAALTPEQWAKVPDKIKFPLGQQPR